MRWKKSLDPQLLFLSSMNLHLLLLLFLLYTSPTTALHNVTIDDTSPLITYTGSWGRSAQTDLNFGGEHMLTQDPGATATFRFSGVGIYFLSPLWPYLVNTLLTLDGVSTLVDLVDHTRPTANGGPESVATAVVWNATGLDSGEHTLVVSVGPGQPFAVLDALMYTVLDPGDPGFVSTSSSSSSSSSSPSSTPSTSTSASSTSTTGRTVASSTPTPTTSSSSSGHVLPIALGTVLGLLGLLLVAAAFWFCLHKRKRPVSEAWTDPPAPSQYDPQQPGYAQLGEGFVPAGAGSPPASMAGVGAGGAYNPYQGYGYGQYQPPVPVPAPVSMRGLNRMQAQPVSTLSTITESSTPRSLAHGTPEMGHRTPDGGLVHARSDLSQGERLAHARSDLSQGSVGRPSR